MSLTKDYFITLVLMELSHQVISSFSDDVRDEKSRRLVELFEWLRINMNKDFSVKEIAIRFNFNKDYLCRIFKEQTGTSVIKYINDTKI
jgi:transcriptional regulator GlxA family with amidase domain